VVWLWMKAFPGCYANEYDDQRAIAV